MPRKYEPKQTDSNLVKFALRELELSKLFSEEGDFYGGMMGDSVLELVDVFSSQGHSGMSAGICLTLFSKVAAYEPISPLIGDDQEWTEVSDGVFQNKRCPVVFREGLGGQAYNIKGRVFRTPSGGSYTSRDSRVYVTFPYVPTTEFVDVPDTE